MPHYRTARHEFHASGVAKEAFRVADFAGDEAISQTYRVEVNLLSDDPEIEFADLINKPATLTMFRGDETSEIDGIVIDFEQSGMYHGQSEYPYLYRAVVAPRLWRLSLSFQSRIFQDLTVEEIVGNVLKDAGVDHEFKLSGAYEPRDYCTQYKETDLDFVQRLLEYEGIRYHFVHDGGAETLVLSDDASDAPAIDGVSDVLFRHRAGMIASDKADSIGQFVARQQLVTGAAEVKDYNYRTPETTLLARSEIDPEQAVGKHSDYGIHVKEGGRTSSIAVVRNEEIETGRLVMTGQGDCQRFRSGHRFALDEHYRDSLNQTYLLTHVRHEGRQTGARDGAAGEAGTDTSYSNAFTCVPASVAYRPPRRTPEPKLPGVLTARVESSGGDYAPVDEQGRYRVRMPFDLGDAGAAQATKAVRLAQPYTGPGYGQHFPVHKDVEMVVACVDGNVDRILGLSTIYNPTQYSPVTSDNAPQSVFRSWGLNELTFDDKKGEENVFMHGTKDHNITINNDQHNSVGNDRTQKVGHDETLEVGHDQAEEVKHDQQLTVGNDRKMDIGVNLDETVGSAMTVKVGDTLDESVGSSQTTSVGTDLSLDVSGNMSESIGSNRTETVSGDKSTEVSSGASLKTGASYTIKAGVHYDLEVSKKTTIKTGASGLVKTGTDLTIQAGKKMVIEAADQISIKCGSAEIVLKKNGDISINGNKIDVKGSGKTTVKGSQIAAN